MNLRRYLRHLLTLLTLLYSISSYNQNSILSFPASIGYGPSDEDFLLEVTQGPGKVTAFYLMKESVYAYTDGKYRSGTGGVLKVLTYSTKENDEFEKIENIEYFALLGSNPKKVDSLVFKNYQGKNKTIFETSLAELQEKYPNADLSRLDTSNGGTKPTVSIILANDLRKDGSINYKAYTNDPKLKKYRTSLKRVLLENYVNTQANEIIKNNKFKLTEEAKYTKQEVRDRLTGGIPFFTKSKYIDAVKGHVHTLMFIEDENHKSRKFCQYTHMVINKNCQIENKHELKFDVPYKLEESFVDFKYVNGVQSVNKVLYHFKQASDKKLNPERNKGAVRLISFDGNGNLISDDEFQLGKGLSDFTSIDFQEDEIFLTGRSSKQKFMCRLASENSFMELYPYHYSKEGALRAENIIETIQVGAVKFIITNTEKITVKDKEEKVKPASNYYVYKIEGGKLISKSEMEIPEIESYSTFKKVLEDDQTVWAVLASQEYGINKFKKTMSKLNLYKITSEGVTLFPLDQLIVFDTGYKSQIPNYFILKNDILYFLASTFEEDNGELYLGKTLIGVEF